MANLAISLNDQTGLRLPAAFLAGSEGDLSICGWRKFNAQPTNSFSVLQQAGDLSNPTANPYLQLYSGDGASAPRQLGFDNGQTFKGTLLEPAIDAWFYVTQTLQKVGPGDYYQRLWVNFVLHPEAAQFTVPLNNDADSVFSGDPAWGAPFNGSVAAEKIFSRLLTAEEQQAESMQRAPVLVADCLGAWGCRGVSDLANLLGGPAASFFHQNPGSPVPAVDVAGPAALDGDESDGILLADLPATLNVENLMPEALVIGVGLRFAPGQTRSVQLAGLAPGAKSDLWSALYLAEQNEQIDAGSISPLIDPIPSGHTIYGGQQLTGGQLPRRTATPE